MEDWFDESYYSTLATDTVMVDPHGPDKPTGFRVMRESANTDVWKPKSVLDKAKWVDWTPPAAGGLK